MLRVNLANRRMETIVKINNPRVQRIARLIQDVVTRNPSIVLVMLSEFLPKPNYAVLKIAMIPKSCIVGSIVRVPVLQRKGVEYLGQF